MSSEELRKVELNLLVEEYKALKVEIVANLNSARQIKNLSLAALGVLITGIPQIVQQRLFIVLLIAPVLFYALAWTQLRYVFLVLEMGVHLRTHVISHVRAILRQLQNPGDDFSFGHIFSWEDEGRSTMPGVLFLPIWGANFVIPLLGAVLCGAIYVAGQGLPRMLEEALALGLNVLALCYSAICGVLAAKRR